jgi:hypothetical protein
MNLNYKIIKVVSLKEKEDAGNQRFVINYSKN